MSQLNYIFVATMALKVRESQLPGAGKGLFTDKPIKENTKIIEYRGEVINWKEYEKRVAEDKDGYLFYIDKHNCIDAYPTRQYKARYANDAEGLTRKNGLSNNASYQVFNNKCYIVAERDIAAGEEIFVDYTKDYWDCIRYNLKNKLYKSRAPFSGK
jgi:SET domain-containing protein